MSSGPFTKLEGDLLSQEKSLQSYARFLDTIGDTNTIAITGTGTCSVNTSGGYLEYTDSDASTVTLEKANANILTGGDYYKLVFTIASAQGSGARIAMNFMPNTVPNYDHVNYPDGTYTIYFEADQGNADMAISGASPSFKMTYVSIRKILGNVGEANSMDATNFPYTSVLPDQSYLTGNSSSYNYFEGDSADEFIDCGTGLASSLGDSYSGKLSVSIWFNQDQTNNTD